MMMNEQEIQISGDGNASFLISVENEDNLINITTLEPNTEGEGEKQIDSILSIAEAKWFRAALDLAITIAEANHGE